MKQIFDKRIFDRKRTVCIALSLCCLASPGWADDMDIYKAGGSGVKPNVLLIFDNSAIMADRDIELDTPYPPYDPNKTYAPAPSSTTEKEKDRVYFALYSHERHVWWPPKYDHYPPQNLNPGPHDPPPLKPTCLITTDSLWTKCPAAKAALASQGFWEGHTVYKQGYYDYGKNQAIPDTIQCTDASTGTVVDSSTAGARLMQFYLGNFLNYNASAPLLGTQSRMALAKQAVATFLHDNYDQARFGLMTFNDTKGVNESFGGYILRGCGSSKEDLIGSFNPDSSVCVNEEQSGLGGIGMLNTRGFSVPLGQTLAEAGRYFAGQKSMYNVMPTSPADVVQKYPFGNHNILSQSGVNTGDYTQYTSPITNRCQKNYVIYMTRGTATFDEPARSTWLGPLFAPLSPYPKNTLEACFKKTPDISVLDDEAGGGGLLRNYLDDLACYLASEDLLPLPANASAAQEEQRGRPGERYEYQTVNTHTIGFKLDKAKEEKTHAQQLLQAAATHGGGTYHTADNPSQLGEALASILANIMEFKETFSAVTVPVSSANRAYAGNKLYFGLFQPIGGKNWLGNIKKYSITSQGVIQDKEGMNALTSNNADIMENAWSWWSPEPDGPSIRKGGAGGKLVSDLGPATAPTNARKVYTYTASADAGGTAITDLTHPNNAFAPTNAAKLAVLNDKLDATAIGKIRHDKLEEDAWPLGSFIHSQPLVVQYQDNDTDPANDPALICAGANDGMLHCFDDADGSEKWAFIPPDLLPTVHKLASATGLQYYVDGSPTLYEYDHDNSSTTPKQKLLIFGERRGGSHYTALDVSNPIKPLFKYSIKPDILGDILGKGDTNSLGQSWAKPKASVIGYTDASEAYKTRDVFIMAGGYDTNQDKVTPADPDTKGRAVFAVDSQTGKLHEALNFNAGNFSAMTHSITDVSAFENPKTRTITRIYAGDMNGSLFAFRDDIFHRNQDKAKADDFEGEYDGKEDGEWGQKLRLIASPGKKIFYPPTIIHHYFPVKFTYPQAEVEGATADVPRMEKRVGDYVYYGTGDREHPMDKEVINEFYAIKNNWQWGTETPAITRAYIDETDGKIKTKDESSGAVSIVVDRVDGALDQTATTPFILDITDNLYQTRQSGATTEAIVKQYKGYVTSAMDHPANKGWFLRFVEADGTKRGEKVMSSPIIYAGVVYFTTFVPEKPTVSTDPCGDLSAAGIGYLYAIGYRYGEAVLDLHPDSASDPNDPEKGLYREDRRTMLKRTGIPPAPQIVVHEGKEQGLVGPEPFELPEKKIITPFYWRQINN